MTMDHITKILILVLYIFVSIRGQTVLNKCCKADEYFSVNDECVHYDTNPYEYEYRENNKIFPVEDLTKRNFSFNFNVRHCTKDYEYLPISFTRFELLKNGSVYRKTETYEPKPLFSKDSYCVESWDVKGALQPAVQLCPCKEHLCVYKCCPSKQHLITVGEKRNCEDYNEDLEEWSFDLLNGSEISQYYTRMYHSPDCKDGFIFMLEDTYNLLDNGSIDSMRYGIIQPKEYCGDFRYENNQRESVLLVCIKDRTPYGELMLNFVICLIGSVFLLATIIVHVWLPELNNVHGKCLVSHASCLLVGYICSAINQFGINQYVRFEPGLNFRCYFLGYLMQFSFLASFFWLNVICVNLSATFQGRGRNQQRSSKKIQRKKFIYYSLYSWGATCILTIITILVDFVIKIPKNSHFKPNIGLTRCWFQDRESLFVFFYGPMGVLLLANLVFFIYTTNSIIQLTRGTSILKRSRDNDTSNATDKSQKERYILYLKIFALMGISWLMEIGWAVEGPIGIWYLINSVNLLRAIFIFFIFCWKPMVWNGLLKKMPCLEKMVKSKKNPNIDLHTHTDEINVNNRSDSN